MGENMRQLHFISQAEETAMAQKLIYQIKRKALKFMDAENTLMLTVSPDFSGIASTIISHGISTEGTAMYSDSIHVPDPGEDVEFYKQRLRNTWNHIISNYDGSKYTKFILCEAGVISGRNYNWLVNTLQELGVSSSDILTIALYENTHSEFKCDLVGQYYDNNTQDLCFWWEQPNRAFGDYSDKESK